MNNLVKLNVYWRKIEAAYSKVREGLNQRRKEKEKLNKH